MRQLFISYARENKPDVEALVRDLDALGYQTWVDSSLRGGQTWWEEILRRIADCDVFVAIVSRHTLNSVVCKRELEWALALNKPVLPLGVESLPAALPRTLSMRQIVDFSQPGKEAAFALAGALANLPPAPPPPTLRPQPPAAPVSYLTDLVELVSAPNALSHDQQRQVIIKLEPALWSVDPEERRGARVVLERFSGRDDLYADVDRTITVLKRLNDQASEPLRAESRQPVARRPSPVERSWGRPRLPVRKDRARDSSTSAGVRLSSSVFAPREVQPGQTFIVRVFAHLPSEDEEVEALARKFDDSSRPMGTDVLDSRVREGERLAFELRLPELLVDDPVQSMVWVGQPRSVQFGVTVPTDSTPQTVIGTVTISRDSVPIGRVTFMVNVYEPEPGLVPGLPSAPRYPGPHLRPNYHRYRRAFISYASADRKEVLKRTQMLPGAGIDFFHDILTLDPGQRWERQLYYEIDRCDLFLLFWSSAAKKSEWVLKEVHHAMKRNGDNELALPEILPVVIEGPPPVPPPPELAHLHFNDRILYFMQPPRRQWWRVWRWRRW